MSEISDALVSMEDAADSMIRSTKSVHPELIDPISYAELQVSQLTYYRATRDTFRSVRYILDNSVNRTPASFVGGAGGWVLILFAFVVGLALGALL